MKSIILLLAFLLSGSIILAQEPVKSSLLTTTESWGEETITFPIDWAPAMTLTGFEELRFAPFLSNPDHDQFWSLVIAWKVSATKELSVEVL
ncbi:MAG: hypothetical protein AAFO69_16720, partial [Bacteroidota bacterium]